MFFYATSTFLIFNGRLYKSKQIFGVYCFISKFFALDIETCLPVKEKPKPKLMGKKVF